MARPGITETQLADHVDKLGAEHPPLALESCDFTIRHPEVLRRRYAVLFDYLARVELEVERNVKELDAILPSAPEVDRRFYRDVWQGQELQHGRILDRVKAELGLPPAEPLVTVGAPITVLGAAARLQPMQDVLRAVYYFSGASTERQAVLAYSALIDRLAELGETALVDTIVHPIKRQEPGHFAFYSLSATKIVAELSPWQLFLVRQLRARSYELVGTHHDPVYQAQMGTVARVLGFADDPVAYAREIGRLEARVLWAGQAGLEFPPYVLAAIEESRRLAEVSAAA